MKKYTWWHILLLLAVVKLLLHLYLNGQWSFHRDELLYLALGRHLDWGYASVPAGIGFWAWLGESILGGSVEAIRFITTLFGTATVVLTGLMAKEMLPHKEGNGVLSMLIVGLAGLLSGAYLRPCMLFMPVVFDIFYWTLLCWLFIKYINSEKPFWLIGLGAVAGIGLLNKYTVAMFLAAMLTSVLLSKNRRIFSKKAFYYAVLLAFFIILPNILWQAKHQFPVLRHMSELATTQFAHVSLSSFLSDQILFFLPAFPVWLSGLYFLFFTKEGSSWRIFGVMYFIVMVILMFFNAKSYYSLGAYPVLIAAGAAFLERLTSQRNIWMRYGVPLYMLMVGAITLPVSLPLLPPQKEAAFMKNLATLPGLKGTLRWEDGKYYDLPQDFADMLGWEEMGVKAGELWQTLPNPSTAVIYGEHYGQAGAVELFGKKYGISQVLSFSDNYRYWLPDSMPSNFQTLIYINDELGDDMPGFFQKIDKIWELDMPLSRQHGDQIYLCQYATPAFFERMNKAFKNAKNEEKIEE